MNSRRPWSKKWDAEYLADATMNQLSFRSRGIVEVLWSFCRTQTDELGVFIRRGCVLTPDAIADLIRQHSATDARTNARYMRMWVLDALQRGPFAMRADGAWFSPRIVAEIETNEKAIAYGRIGAEKRWGSESRYNGVTKPADPIATPIDPPMGLAIARSEEEEDIEAEQPRARARDYSGNRKDEPGTVAAEAVAALERMADVDLTESDVAKITAACDGKSAPQVRAAIDAIRREHLAGKIRILVPFSEKLIREQGPVRVEVDRDEAIRIQQARQLCEDLQIPWPDFHVHALEVVKRHTAGTKRWVDATWNDYHAGVLARDATPRQWWDRFTQHIENREVATT